VRRPSQASAASAIYDINLVRFAEETLTLEIGFCTYVTQSIVHFVRWGPTEMWVVALLNT
jgi:hypothetical protein